MYVDIKKRCNSFTDTELMARISNQMVNTSETEKRFDVTAWGINTRNILKIQGRSVSWLADCLGQDRAKMGHLLNGTSKYNPSYWYVKQTAVFLGVPSYLLLADPHHNEGLNNEY